MHSLEDDFNPLWLAYRNLNNFLLKFFFLSKICNWSIYFDTNFEFNTFIIIKFIILINPKMINP